MNDDDLIGALREAMGSRTAGDVPSRDLMLALSATRVRGPRPYLVPFSAAAVVTALTTGGVLVAQTGGGPLTAGADPSLAPAPASASAPAPAPASVSATASVAPVTIASVAPVPVTVPATTAVPTTAAVPTTLAAPSSAAGPKPPTTPAVTAIPQGGLPVPDGDDSALLAAAKSYSVVTSTVADAAHPSVKTHAVEVFPHDSSKSFYTGRDGIDWDQLAALPTDQAAFVAKVTAPGAPPNAVEKGVQELIPEGPMPLPVRKEALAMLESAPGATTTGAHDHLGRPAIKVSVTTDLLVDDYYFDPVSDRLLETGTVFTDAWKASYVATEPPGALPVSEFTTGYTSYSDWIITPKSS